jgi:hypothetical protein
VYLEYGRGVDPDGAIREVGIAPRPLQNPIPVYSGFTHSLQTSLSFREVFLLFGQGILERDRCLKTLELFAEKVIPRFQ